MKNDIEIAREAKIRPMIETSENTYIDLNSIINVLF
jgi:hypothetical protein